jgi:hypothetical protein
MSTSLIHATVPSLTRMVMLLRGADASRFVGCGESEFAHDPRDPSEAARNPTKQGEFAAHDPQEKKSGPKRARGGTTARGTRRHATERPTTLERPDAG